MDPCQVGNPGGAKGPCQQDNTNSLPVVAVTAGGLQVRVRTAEESDVANVIAMVTEASWVENVCEYSAMFSTDPQCWFVAENAETGEVLGHCCGLKVGQHLAAVHTYITAPGYRGRGVGSLLWSRLMQRFQDRTLILSAVDGTVSMYSRLGLRPLYQWKMLKGPIIKEKLPARKDSEAIHIPELRVDSPCLGEVHAYDRRISMFGRPMVLEAWISHDRSRAAIACESSTNSPLGYGVIFRANDEWHLSPLYAETEEAAWLITHRLLEDVANGEVVVTYTPAANERACSVWHALGLSCQSVHTVMTGDPEHIAGKLPLHKVFSMISTAPFGYV